MEPEFNAAIRQHKLKLITSQHPDISVIDMSQYESEEEVRGKTPLAHHNLWSSRGVSTRCASQCDIAKSEKSEWSAYPTDQPMFTQPEVKA